MIDQQIPTAQLEPIGRAGRKLLGLGLENAQNARFYLPVAIPAVCRTYALAPTESEDLIRRVVQPERLAQGSIEGLHWLAGSIKALMPVAPALVEDIYRAIFDAPDMPDDKVPLYDSQILPLTTTLRQEFDGARYQLVEAFGDFLVAAPERALRVLAHVVEVYIRDRPGHEEEPRVFEIPFADQVAHFAADASYIWDDRRTYEHDLPMMLKAFQKHLAVIASTDDAPVRFSAILGHIVSHHRRAVVWRRLLMSAAKHPATLGKLLTPLLKAPIILITPDTYTAAGELLRAVYPHLDEEERRAIEAVIMVLPDHPLLQEDARRERKRARLLGCLPLDYVVTTAASELIAALRARNEIPANEPAFAWEPEDLDSGDIEKMMWRHEGIPFDSPENVTFRAVCAQFRSSAAVFLMVSRLSLTRRPSFLTCSNCNRPSWMGQKRECMNDFFKTPSAHLHPLARHSLVTLKSYPIQQLGRLSLPFCSMPLSIPFQGTAMNQTSSLIAAPHGVAAHRELRQPKD